MVKWWYVHIVLALVSLGVFGFTSAPNQLLLAIVNILFAIFWLLEDKLNG